MANRRLYGAIALLSLCVVAPALGQTFESNPLALEPGAHAVGFRLLASEDRARLVTGGVGSLVHPRPVRTYLCIPRKAQLLQAEISAPGSELAYIVKAQERFGR